MPARSVRSRSRISSRVGLAADSTMTAARPRRRAAARRPRCCAVVSSRRGRAPSRSSRSGAAGSTPVRRPGSVTAAPPAAFARWPGSASRPPPRAAGVQRPAGRRPPRRRRRGQVTCSRRNGPALAAGRQLVRVGDDHDRAAGHRRCERGQPEPSAAGPARGARNSPRVAGEVAAGSPCPAARPPWRCHRCRGRARGDRARPGAHTTPSCTRTRGPSRTAASPSAPAPSTSTTPASASTRGPGCGYRPRDLAADVDHRGDARVHQRLSRRPVQVEHVEDGHVTGPEPRAGGLRTRRSTRAVPALPEARASTGGRERTV